MFLIPETPHCSLFECFVEKEVNTTRGMFQFSEVLNDVEVAKLSCTFHEHSFHMDFFHAHTQTTNSVAFELNLTVLCINPQSLQ